MLTFDLHSLATLAAARALEMGGEVEGAEAGQQCPIRRRLNLRRKSSWTPRHEPVRLLINECYMFMRTTQMIHVENVCKSHTMGINSKLILNKNKISY